MTIARIFHRSTTNSIALTSKAGSFVGVALGPPTDELSELSVLELVDRNDEDIVFSHRRNVLTSSLNPSIGSTDKPSPQFPTCAMRPDIPL